MAVRDSPSSKPPPDKRVSNEKTTPASIEVPMTVNASDHTKTMVSEAPVLLSPPPSQSTEGQGIMQPLPPSQPTSRESLAQRAIPKPSSSKQQQSKPTIGYQGTPQAQRTVEDVMDDYPGLKVTNS